MKKKGIIIGLIVLLSSITAIILVLTLRNTKTRLVLDSSDGAVTLDLGKYKVKDYKKDSNDRINYNISFYVNNKNDFYNEVIIKSNGYIEELDFDVDYYDIDYYAYGYFVLNDRLFNYLMDDSGYVWIASRSGIFHTDTDGYLLPVPIASSISYERLSSDNETGYYQKLSDYFTNYEMISKIARYMPSYTKIEDDGVYVKGCYLNKDTNQDVLTDDYLIKIYEDENGIVKVGNVY